MHPLACLRSGLASLIGRFGSDWRLRKRRALEWRLVSESELFDPDWYAATYPDIAAAQVDPVRHYIESGWREGRDPSADFSTTHYLRTHRDVAELGINPLVHFLEYGEFEGRDIQGVSNRPRALPQGSPNAPDLGPAFPVVQGRINPTPVVSWLRACNLAARLDAVRLDGYGLAIPQGPKARASLTSLLADLEGLSGQRRPIEERQDDLGSAPNLIDAWLGSGNRLFSRWAVTEPTVIRVVQIDPARDRLTLVDEGLAVAPVDAVPFNVASATLPILFVAVRPDGDLVGTLRLAFPSLARGGPHYSELIDAAAAAAQLDLVGTSRRLERQLRLIRSGKEMAAVGRLVIDLSGSDGTGPIFQPDIRCLLERVIGINVETAGGDERSAGYQYLAPTAPIRLGERAGRGGSTLTIGADMAPTLSALVAVGSPADPRAAGSPSALIVADPDPAQPAVRFEVPELPAGNLGQQSGHQPPLFPKLAPAHAMIPAVAIRTVARALDDVEYYYPHLFSDIDPEVASLSVDWLIDGEGDDDLLTQSLMAVGVPHGIGRQRLCFLKRPADAVLKAAEADFGGRWNVFDSVEEALARSDADLVAYHGAGVILHNPRTAAVLAGILLDESVATASCVLVASTRHGRNWQPRVADAGELPLDRKVIFGGLADDPAQMLWRGQYPVIRPPVCLWMARRDAALGWKGGGQPESGLHLVTSNISATIEPTAAKEHGRFSPPESRSGIRAKVLVG